MNKQNYHLNHFFRQTKLFDNINLLQIGRKFFAENGVIEKHVHLDWYELTVARGGNGILSTNNIDVPMKTGDIYLSLPGDIHAIYSDSSSPFDFDFLSVIPNDGVYLLILKNIRESFQDPKSRLFSDEIISSLVGNAIAEFGKNGVPRSQEIVSHILQLIIYYLNRNFNETGGNCATTDPKKTELFCFSLMQYIDTHIFSLKSLTELSEVFGYEYSYISKLFTRNTGHTLWNYYQNCRLTRAKLLVQNKTLPIGKIAETLNYSSVYAFSKAYKNMFGYSPTATGKT